MVTLKVFSNCIEMPVKSAILQPFTEFFKKLTNTLKDRL